METTIERTMEKTLERTMEGTMERIVERTLARTLEIRMLKVCHSLGPDQSLADESINVN